MSTNAVGASAAAQYAVSVEKKALDQSKVEAANAAKLIESASPKAPEPKPLPDQATFSSYA